MKRFAALVSMLVLAGVVQAMAAGLITKGQAVQDALTAVGGGTVDRVYRDKELSKLIWSVDITGSADYEVWVDAHSGAILRIITQPLSANQQGKFISKAQAEQDALNAVGGGTILHSHRDQFQGTKIWDVDVSQPGVEFTVYVDARSGAILKVIKQIQPAGAKFISKAQAKQIALDAVGGGKVLLSVLDKKDNPATWSIDVRAAKGGEFEVKINALSGAVIAIIPGH